MHAKKKESNISFTVGLLPLFMTAKKSLMEQKTLFLF